MLETALVNMLSQQLRAWGVLEPKVLKVMEQVQRAPFLPQAYQGIAYSDSPLPLNPQVMTLEPKVIGQILQALDPSPTDHILEVGTGSGYLTALLAKLSHSVHTVEIDQNLLQTAAVHLEKIGLHNVSYQHADGAYGVESTKQFDCIVITGSLPVLPAPFHNLLTHDGRLFAFIGTKDLVTATLFKKTNKSYTTVNLFETQVRPLQNGPARDTFQF